MFEELQVRLRIAIDKVVQTHVEFTLEEAKNFKVRKIACNACKQYLTFDMTNMLKEKRYLMPFYAYIVNKKCKQHLEEFMKYKNAEKI